MARVDTVEHFLSDVASSMRTASGESKQYQASKIDEEIIRIIQEHSSDPDKKAYQVSSVQEMNQLTTMQEGDLCAVYTYHYDNIFDLSYCPTRWYVLPNITVRNEITNTYTNSYVIGSSLAKTTYKFTLTPTQFVMTSKSVLGSESERIKYESSDGIHYRNTLNGSGASGYFTINNILEDFNDKYKDFEVINYICSVTSLCYYDGSSWASLYVEKPIPEEKDVNFYDYDGTLLYSYTKEEALALTALPKINTSHEGLTAYGWNWSNLTTIKNYVTTYGYMDIGALYTPTDNKTHIFIDIPQGSKRLDIRTGAAINGTLTVDWGDGSEPTTITGTSTTAMVSGEHTYSSCGKYEIKIAANSTAWVYRVSTYSGAWSPLCHSGSYNTGAQYVKKIYFSNSYRLSDYALYGLQNLECVSFANNVAINKIGSSYPRYVFYQTSNLKYIFLGGNLSVLGSDNFLRSGTKVFSCSNFSNSESLYGFTNAYNLERISCEVTMCSGLFSNAYSLTKCAVKNYTTISQNAFRDCPLQVIDNKGDVTQINDYAFSGSSNYSTNFKVIKFLNCTTVPVINGTMTFVNLPSDCVIVVPDALYDEWIAANVWSGLASRIVRASDYTD